MVNQNSHVKGLIDNACRFLERAAGDLSNGEIALSVINFYTAIELVLKARLVSEHWSLSLAKPSVANARKFEAGDIVTVSLADALDRIDKVLNEPLPDITIRVFNDLRKYRNKLVHFHGPEWPTSKWSNTPEAEKARENAISLECRAWLDLHQLLTVQWRAHFEPSQYAIHSIESDMAGIRTYLKIKYDRIKPDLDKRSSEGDVFHECPSCGFEAMSETERRTSLYSKSCEVCGYFDMFYTLACNLESCDGSLEIRDLGISCTKCDNPIDLDGVADALIPYFDARDGGEENRAYCGECNSFEIADGTVVPSTCGEFYLCLACLQDFEAADITRCEWCNTRFTGDDEGTFLSGCLMCEGRMGHGND